MSAEKDPTPPPKFSRYRSVRRQAEVARCAPPPLPEPMPAPAVDTEPKSQAELQSETSTPAVSRSMSRYRRSRAVSKADYTNPHMPPMPSIPPMPPPQRVGTNLSSNQDISSPVRSVPGSPEVKISKIGFPTTSQQQSNIQARTTRQPIIDARIRKEQEQRRAVEEVAQRKQEEERVVKEQERAQEEKVLRILEEQKRKDLERLVEELEAAAPRISPQLQEQSSKFALFKRRGNKSPPLNSPNSSLAAKDAQEPPPIQSIQHGGVGGGIVPGDAPVSAVNSGERRVLVRCQQSSINLPCSVETTCADLIYTACNIMTQNITPSAAILLESYTQLGLERRVRQYEHVRDIMNSWDRDTQNAFNIQSSDSPNYEKDLDLLSVPRVAPKGVTVQLYHSQKPGKWNKRYITILSSGQIYTAKKAGAKPSADKDVVNICHLSDFDIYSPTPQQIRKSLRPPKKLCYAVKSQQKTTMFLSTENFVHFFCTEDQATADLFYTAVQNWRSWYLVHKRGEGRKGAVSKAVGKVSLDPVGKAPYTIGSFTPLFDSEKLISSAGQHEYDSDEERFHQVPFHLRNNASLPSDSISSHRESRRHPPPVSYKLPPDVEEEFASNSLLGRSYTQRRTEKDLEAQNAASIPASIPSNHGPPQGYQGHRRSLSVKTTKTSRPTRPLTSSGPAQGGVYRDLDTAPMPPMPAPLLSFRAEFQEAPQWDAKNRARGRGVEAPAGVLLVDVANTPDGNGTNGPTTMIFRRETAEGAIRPKTAKSIKSPTLRDQHEGAFVQGGLVSGLK